MTELFQTEATNPAQRAYTVLARRYRSRTFEEVVGQEPIARTLSNAIAAGRTAHAYLFCGTRGVGKTSMARIFGKALNVTPDLKQGPEIAEAILRGDDLDVIEIDGASNRGIDQARDLIANAGISPTRCRYKIYIIDEVHMLTKDAFNALLKTMEEPPSHVKFILCTTEPHKVLATIQSRCQRFDFRALTSAQIAGQLRRIMQQEGLAADDDVLMQVARMGHGSMRDSLSILDRLLSTGEKMLSMTTLEQTLGLPDQTVLYQLADAIAAGDAKAALAAAAELMARGATVEQALESLMTHLRDLMIVAACGEDSDLLELPAETRRAVAKQAGAFDAAGLVHMIALCETASRNARSSSAAQALFDAVIVRLCMSEHLASIPALLGESGAAPATTPPRSAEKKNEHQSQSHSRSQPQSHSRPAPEPLTPPGPAHAVAEVKSSPAPAGQLPIAELWRLVVDLAAATPSDQAKLQHLECQSFDGRTLRLALGTSGAGLAGFLKTQTGSLAELVRRATGRTIRVELDTRAAEAAAPAPPQHALVEEAMKLPVVKKAMELFDATIVRVEDAAQAPAPAAATEEPSRA